MCPVCLARGCHWILPVVSCMWKVSVAELPDEEFYNSTAVRANKLRQCRGVSAGIFSLSSWERQTERNHTQDIRPHTSHLFAMLVTCKHFKRQQKRKATRHASLLSTVLQSFKLPVLLVTGHQALTQPDNLMKTCPEVWHCLTPLHSSHTNTFWHYHSNTV